MAAKTVQVTKKDSDFSLEVELLKSDKKGMNWKVPVGSDGLHFKSLDSVEKHYQKRYPKGKITIS